MQKGLDIIFEDDSVVVVNKPPFILSIPDRSGKDPNNILSMLRETRDSVFTVHRIDKETSGAIVFAKTAEAHRHLSMQFENRETKKVYLTLVDGVLHTESGTINNPITEHPSIAGKMMVAKKGKDAITDFKLRKSYKLFSLVEADIKTGRMHQIRVHFQSIGYPLAVDKLYGKREELFADEIKTKKFKMGDEEGRVPLIKRSTLHAQTLSFTHPVTLERVTFEAPLPKDFRAVIQQLERWGK